MKYGTRKQKYSFCDEVMESKIVKSEISGGNIKSSVLGYRNVEGSESEVKKSKLKNVRWGTKKRKRVGR